MLFVLEEFISHGCHKSKEQEEAPSKQSALKGFKGHPIYGVVTVYGSDSI